MKKVFTAACFHVDAKNKCSYNTQTLYGQGIINDVLMFTDHSVRIVTNDLEGFLKYKDNPRVEILYPCLDGLTIEYPPGPYGFAGFNYNLKYLCFQQPFNEEYEAIIYSDSDQKINGWDESLADQSIADFFKNGCDLIAGDADRAFDFHLLNFEANGGKSPHYDTDLFANKFIGYGLNSSNVPSGWRGAMLPSENYLVIKNNQRKVQAFYESWGHLNYRLQKSESFAGAHHDGFEIGIAAQEAGLTICNLRNYTLPFSMEYNGRKYKQNVKVKVCANWTDCQSVTRRLINQFKITYDDISNIDFVEDDSYDLIVFFNHVTEEIKPGSKALLFSNEPDWSGTRQWTVSEYKDADFFVIAQNKEVYDQPEKVAEEPVCMFYGGRGEEDWTYKNIVEDKDYFKSKAISSIVSKFRMERAVMREGAERCLYDKRIKIIQSLIDEGLSGEVIDVYGWECAEGCSELVRKIEGLKDYRFSLCIENSEEDNLITEKFHDAILTDTIPIYYGAPNIKDIYPEEGYILLENLEDVEAVIDTIKWVFGGGSSGDIESLYKKMIPEARKIKERFLKQNNPFRRIKKFIKENMNEL